jgi:hypothetical protein
MKQALQITNELWKNNIWDFEQVNMVYGFYKAIPGESWSSVIRSLNQLKGILTARHSNVKKELAKNKGYKLPDAMVIELPKLTEGISFSDEGYKEYFRNMRELNTNAEEGVKASKEAVTNFETLLEFAKDYDIACYVKKDVKSSFDKIYIKRSLGKEKELLRK